MTHTIEPRAVALRELKQTLGSLKCGPLSHHQFDVAHECFEGSSDQQSLILAWLQRFGSRALKRFSTAEQNSNQEFQILSVGCGSGILDNPLIETLSRTASTCGDRMRIAYWGIDPNPVACERFRESFEAMEVDNVRLTVSEATVETMTVNSPIQMACAVHSLYYFVDPAASLSELIDHLARDGELVIFQAPKGALNQLADCFWNEHPASDIWFSECLETHLQAGGIEFSLESIDAHVDVTQCFDPDSERGRNILDFIIQRDCGDLGKTQRASVLAYLKAISQEDDERILAPHPVDAFVIRPATTKVD